MVITLCGSARFENLFHEWKLKYPRPTDVHEYTQEGLNRFKEEILNRNIESFIYDW